MLGLEMRLSKMLSIHCYGKIGLEGTNDGVVECDGEGGRFEVAQMQFESFLLSNRDASQASESNFKIQGQAVACSDGHSSTTNPFLQLHTMTTLTNKVDIRGTQADACLVGRTNVGVVLKTFPSLYTSCMI